MGMVIGQAHQIVLTPARKEAVHQTGGDQEVLTVKLELKTKTRQRKRKRERWFEARFLLLLRYRGTLQKG